MAAYDIVQPDIEPDNPVMLVGIDGWIDAGMAGANAVAALLAEIETEPYAVFDGDRFIDYRARRPTMSVERGVIKGVKWPTLELRWGRHRDGLEVLVLNGPEPDMEWRAFQEAAVELAQRCRARMAVGLRAFPAAVPHTRPVRVSATARRAEMAALVGAGGGAYEVPAGMHALYEYALDEAGIPSLGIWARVPHYVAGNAFPAASVALLEAFGRVSGAHVDALDLREAAEVTRRRIDELIGQSSEHTKMVRNLEAQADAEAEREQSATASGPGLDATDLPSGDEIAAELERFLRGEPGDQGQ